MFVDRFIEVRKNGSKLDLFFEKDDPENVDTIVVSLSLKDAELLLSDLLDIFYEYER